MTDTGKLEYEPSQHADDQHMIRQTSQEETVHAVDEEDGPVDTGLAELGAMQAAYAALVVLDENARHRAVTWLIESLRITGLRVESSTNTHSSVEAGDSESGSSRFSETPTPTPREFMSRKKPQSHVERIACLSYYLANYRDVRHFKSAEIADLNIEAAGQKFGNLSRDVDNADRSSGYIVSAGKGAKQLTTRGEAVVEALPDREAVKLALQEYPYRVKRSSGSGKKAGPLTEDDQ